MYTEEINAIYHEEELVCAILEQSIEDYKTLKERGVEEICEAGRSKYSLKEIEAFFKSNWCETLLSYVSSKTVLSGENILKAVQMQG